MRNFLFLLSLLVIVLGLGLNNKSMMPDLFRQAVGNENPVKFATVKGSNILLELEIADTEKSREKGLSGRLEVDSDGMIFIFSEPKVESFWMKDMNFDLHMIWLDEEGKVVQINPAFAEDYNPKNPEDSKFYTTTKPIKYVLEIPYKADIESEIKEGDTLEVNY